MATEPNAALAAAILHEQAIADEAAQIRGDETDLTTALFMKLWPLLRKPIPEAFIVTTGIVKGKPYESTGVKSVQVLSGRMDAVLTPCSWWEEIHYFGDDVDYERGGNLCEVTVHVGVPGEKPLFSRSSRGGVNQASTLGNRYKGSYTNAAKRAFAAVGPGHEIYLGAADLDPDTNPDAAKQQDRPVPAEEMKLTDAQRQRVLVAFVDAGIADDELQLFLRSVGLDSADDMQLSHALALREKLDEHIRGGAS
jgi:hypothetical protein